MRLEAHHLNETPTHAPDTIRSILGNKEPRIWFVTPETTVYEAIAMMDEKGVGALLVMDLANALCSRAVATSKLPISFHAASSGRKYGTGMRSAGEALPRSTATVFAAIRLAARSLRRASTRSAAISARSSSER